MNNCLESSFICIFCSIDDIRRMQRFFRKYFGMSFQLGRTKISTTKNWLRLSDPLIFWRTKVNSELFLFSAYRKFQLVKKVTDVPFDNIGKRWTDYNFRKTPGKNCKRYLSSHKTRALILVHSNIQRTGALGARALSNSYTFILSSCTDDVTSAVYEKSVNQLFR